MLSGTVFSPPTSFLALGLLACSGPGAGELIQRNIRTGLLLWAVALLVAVTVSVLSKRWTGRLRPAWPSALMAAIHPGWWLSARMGDCGQLLFVTAAAATPVVLAVAAAVVWRLRTRSS